MSSSVENKRRHVRKKTSQQVSVLNVLSGETIGTVVNLHPEGFMLLGSCSIQADGVYQLELVFEKSIDGKNHISLGAQCLWSKGADMAGQSWIGFHIIDSDPDDHSTLEKLVHQIGD